MYKIVYQRHIGLVVWLLLFLHALPSASAFPVPASSAPQISINRESTFPKELNGSIHVYQTREKITAAECLALIRIGRMSHAIHHATPGYTLDYFWLHFQLRNETSDISDFVLELDNQHLDLVEVYRMDQDGKPELAGRSGNQIFFRQRTEMHRKLIFDLYLPQDQTTELLIMVDKRNASVSFPLLLWSEQVFYRKDTIDSIINNSFLGITGFIGLASLVIGGLLRNRLFISYGIYVLVVGAFFFNQFGYSFQFFHPDATEFNNYTRAIMALLVFCSSIDFFRRFLNIRTHLPWFSKAISGTIIFLAGAAILWFLLHSFIPGLTSAFINPLLVGFFSVQLIFLTALAFSLIYLWNYERRAVMLFSVSCIAAISGAMLLIGMEFGWIPQTLFPVNPFLFGSFIEIMVLTFAMMITLVTLIATRNTLLEENQQLNEEIDRYSVTVLQLKNGQVLNIEDIIYLQADGHYVRFYLNDRKHPLIDRNTLTGIQKQLSPRRFIRIHRSCIIHLKYVQTIYYDRVILTTGTELPVSKSYRPQMKEITV